MTAPLALPQARVFSEVPLDSGHFPGPYFEQVLRGLRTEAPAYVLDLLADHAPPEELTRLVAGVVPSPSRGIASRLAQLLKGLQVTRAVPALVSRA